MYACIDLGSNSFHLLIGEWEKGRVRIIERLSDKVQLGENVKSTGKISPRAYQRGLACLHQFKLLMRQYPLQKYWALGTNTFRVASNADEFIQAAKTLGIDIAIISGVQEAVLIYAGVISALPVSDVTRLIVDIGGGSTEVVLGKGQDRLITESYSIGSVAWRDLFFSDSGFSQSQLLQQMDLGSEQAKNVFASLAPGVKRAGWLEAYASSGTVKMLSYICEEQGYGARQIKKEAIYALKERLANVIATGQSIAGLNEARRDLLLPGWCILVGLMETYEVSTINFSATALREGMLDFMVKNEKTLKCMTYSDLPEVSFAKH